MAERISITDSGLTSELEKWVLRTLQGSNTEPGLYHTISHGVTPQDSYWKMVGMVFAYESVLRTMYEISKRTGEAVEEKVVLSRPGLN